MTSDDRFDLLLTDGLMALAPTREPDRLVPEILRAARREHRRPRWLALLKEPPMRISSHVAVGSPTLRLAATLALTMASLLALAGVVVAGASLSPGPSVVVPAVRNGLIAFDSNGDIWVTNADDTGRTQLTTGPSWDRSPIWSPQGDRIAYWSQRNPDAPYVLIVMNADGSDPQRVRDLVGDRLSLSSDVTAQEWSPDGSRIAYSVTDGTSVWIESLDVVSGRSRRLGEGSDPRWSPDATMIAYAGGPSLSEVWIMAAEGSEPHRIASGSGPMWSPTGRIAYWAGEGGANDIWVVDPDGTGNENVTDSPDDEYWPSWSPDGTRLAFDRYAGQFSSNHIVVSAPDGTDQVTLQGELVTGGPPVWAPDGSRLLFSHFDPQEGENAIEVFDTSASAAGFTIPAEGHVGNVSWQALAP